MLTFEEILDLTGDSGLRTSKVAEFRQRFGANEMTPPVREPLWKQYLKKFNDPIIRILLLAVIISTVVSIVKGSGLLDTIGII
ncbi:MAG TPA: cation-transporting P-type ATPase, partial [Methanoregula sp.]|nr:cation-transporting P-type ATPase [Methanoregula sp.]